MRRRAILLLCVLALARGALAGTVGADHEHFQYTGRIDFSRKSAPKITWPGTYVKARFTGTSLGVILADEKGENRFSVFVDGDHESPRVIRCTRGKSTYDVAGGLAAGEHSVLIFKRTEGDQGVTIFGGLVLGSGGKLLPPGPRPRLRMEVIGDSISCGLGNEAKNKKQEHDAGYKNNFLAYGAITARELDADYMCTSKSGIGLIKSWFPITMPQYHYQLFATDGGPRWDFKKWQPHIVVINLFQNDSWIIKKSTPGDAERVEAYVRFIKTIRGHYPDAHIFCTLGTMSASKTKWAGYVETAARMVNGAGDPSVYSYIFKGGTGSMHPKVSHHRQMAAELTEFIKSKSIRGDEPKAVQAKPEAAPAAPASGAPSGPSAKDEKEAERFYKMARQAEKMGQRGAAATFYARVIKNYPDLLKAAGYFTSNPGKTDYNIGGRDDKACWDHKGGRGGKGGRGPGWRQRKDGQPFFAVVNIGDSHESRAHGKVENTRNDPAKMKLFSYHPDLPVIRKNYAKYADAVEKMDAKVKGTLDALKEDGLYEDTIIVYCSDHGGVMARSKRFVYSSGIHCPLVVRIPEKWKHLYPAERPGMTVDRIVSFVDMPKTWLSLAGAEIPDTVTNRFR